MEITQIPKAVFRRNLEKISKRAPKEISREFLKIMPEEFSEKLLEKIKASKIK